ncbi:DNA cytosine methyltransferase [Amycolatopsis sp. WAC 01375]|uniref:DNA cytosine methyltransferase n=1 Tax=Amycolatopsis sp. WAC 01375 TaxID=2203194 RepID=UPI000F766A48|nr:DNA cytosine methyltransferase [Amycolatopsis sp. WAC 01375]RSM83414.1 DNA cytosine methyltransferase [Amycolatopsis sp. WAC 01375]
MTAEPPNTVEQVHMVDLFAGPGGLDVAAHWLGVTVDGVEWDDDACATREAAGLRTLHADVRDFGPRDFPEATVLAGGPPCQTYTVAGRGEGRRALETVLGYVKRMGAGHDVRPELKTLDDERTGLVLEPLRWAIEAWQAGRPYEAIVLEQVPAVLPVWLAYKDALEGLGEESLKESVRSGESGKTATARKDSKYRVVCGILHTEEFGVPQTRKRAILIARLTNEEVPRLPEPTHRRYRKGVKRAEGDPELREWVTMAEATEIPRSFKVVSNYGTGGDPKARGERKSVEPAATVTGKVTRNRVVMSDGTEDRFTPPLAGRLQTFPKDYPWSGKAVGQQIGNAIPPRLAVHVLAAALGRKPVEESLDSAVKGSWTATKDSCPVKTVPLTAEAEQLDITRL